MYHSLSVVEMSFKFLLKKAYKYSPDVIHCHDISVLPFGVILKVLKGSKLIYDAHELESEKNGLTGKLSFLTRVVERLRLFINSLIVVSPSIGKWYGENIEKKRLGGFKLPFSQMKVLVAQVLT